MIRLNETGKMKVESWRKSGNKGGLFVIILVAIKYYKFNNLSHYYLRPLSDANLHYQRPLLFCPQLPSNP